MRRSNLARGYLSSARWLITFSVITTCLVAGTAAADEKWIISGKVTDADGRAVPGAVVRGIDFEQRRAETVSGDDGKFELTAPAEARSVSLTVMDRAQTQLWVGPLYRAASEKQGEVAAVLGPSREVTVEVIDGRDQPVDGATVLATEQFVDLALVKTGKDGLARVRLPSKTNMCAIYALKSGAGYDYFSNDRRDDSNFPLKDKVEAPPRVKLKLNGSRTARVQAVDSRGQPLAGVIVRPWYVNRVGNPGQTNFSGCNIFQRETGSDGVASFDWLPNDIQYGVTFMSRSREFCTPDNLTVKANDPRTDFQLRFLRQTKLAGRVLGPDGNPVAGAAVRAVGTGVSATGEHPGNGGQGEATTRADGRFEMDLYPEQAYVLAVTHERWAAHRIGVIVREGKPVTDVELKLAEGIVVRGRITRGPDKSPVAGTYVNLQLEGGRIPDEIEKLRHPNDKYWHGMSMSFHTQSDKEGNFRFVASPGEYSLIGPPHADPVKLLVDEDKEIVRNFHLPGEDEAPFQGLVVDGNGRPIAQAIVVAYYASARHRRLGFNAQSDADGRFTVQAETQPFMIHIASKDRTQAIVAEIDVEQTDVRFELRPTVTARGRLLGRDGKPMPGGVIKYGVKVHQGDKKAPWMTSFGGSVKAGPQGEYELSHLAPGAEWDVNYEQSERGPWSKLALVTVEKPGDIDLGDTTFAGREAPSVPPTTEELVARQFRTDKPLPLRRADARAEAKREYLRILLVLADPESPLTRDLYAALRDRKDDKMSRANNDYQALWVAAKSTDDVAKIAREMSIDLGNADVPTIAILDADGSLRGTLTLADEAAGKIDPVRLREFLVSHMLPPRDAEQALAEAFAIADREGKRVFLQETATWCGPCRMLSRFIDRHRDIFDANYVWLKIDRERHTHGEQIMKRIRKERTGGIPWVVILDSAGAELGTSESDKGENYGFPSEKPEIADFMRLLKSTAPRLTDEQAEILRNDLAPKAAPAKR